MRSDWTIEAEIARAETLPSEVYLDPAWHERIRDEVFARSWHWLDHEDVVRRPGRACPRQLSPGMLDEPVLVSRDLEDRLHVLANVCTHRGNLVCEGDVDARELRCRYHGRRFQLDGRFKAMPEFDGVEGFPSPADDLPRLEWEAFGPFLFGSLDPIAPLAEMLAPVRERVGFMPLAELAFDASRSRDYLVDANWMLYCDNYLEGFHIPFVHAGLAGALDYGSYRSELFEWANLQLGIASSGQDSFRLPADHPDAGLEVAAYYFWVFPNWMLNFYPWGLSVNLVEPVAAHRTRVRFLTWVWREERLDRGAGAGLDRVEREDEAVVEAVQQGLRSRRYDRGRYSVKREAGVHHFHRLLARALGQA